jgi:hypothetical protein
VEKNVTNHHESVRASFGQKTQKKKRDKKRTTDRREREMILSLFYDLNRQKVPSKPFSSTQELHQNVPRNY